MALDAPSILVVDDEDDIRATLVGYLQATIAGVRVLQAANGRDAVRMLESGPVDLVISDFRMPVMDGLQLVRFVHERWPGTASFLLTAYPDMDIAVQALNEGKVRRFLTKPVDPQALLTSAQEALEALRWARARDEALNRAASVGARPPSSGAGAP